MNENKLNISGKTKIYVCCPADFISGGPELLHQLVCHLNKLGLRAFIYYYDKKEDTLPHKMYAGYNNQYVDHVEDKQENIIITPEVNTSILYDYKNIQKVIFWLSVDNYYEVFYATGKIKKMLKYILRRPASIKFYEFEKNENISHFVQSEYAKQHLLSKEIENINFLGDYLNDLFIKKQLNNIECKKENIVVYNPEKGIEFTNKIINLNKEIKFVPVKNMTRAEVVNLFSSAKVYIDFGNHPGKDRIPREAAISGCCIITNKQGSAKYDDVAIRDEFKFDNNDSDIPEIVAKINDCLVDYITNIAKFEEYRNIIQNEKNAFINNIKNIFISESDS
jgi:hypothetical protein